MSLNTARIVDVDENFESIQPDTFTLAEATIIASLRQKINNGDSQFPKQVIQNLSGPYPAIVNALASYQLSNSINRLSNPHSPTTSKLGTAKSRTRYLSKLHTVLYFPPIQVHVKYLREFFNDFNNVGKEGISYSEWKTRLNRLLERYLEEVSTLTYISVNGNRGRERDMARHVLRLDARVMHPDDFDKSEQGIVEWSAYKLAVNQLINLFSNHCVSDLLRVTICNPSAVTSTIAREKYLRTFVPITLLTGPIVSYMQLSTKLELNKLRTSIRNADALHAYLVGNKTLLIGLLDEISESSKLDEDAYRFFDTENSKQSLTKLDNQDSDKDDEETLRRLYHRALIIQGFYQTQSHIGRGRQYLLMPNESQFMTEEALLTRQLTQSRRDTPNGGKLKHDAIFQSHLIERVFNFSHFRNMLVEIPDRMNHHLRFGDTLMESVTIDRQDVKYSDEIISLTDHFQSIRFVVTIEPKVKVLIFNEIIDPLRSRLPGENW
jgi:hypothetical protein